MLEEVWAIGAQPRVGRPPSRPDVLKASHLGVWCCPRARGARLVHGNHLWQCNYEQSGLWGADSLVSFCTSPTYWLISDWYIVFQRLGLNKPSEEHFNSLLVVGYLWRHKCIKHLRDCEQTNVLSVAIEKLLFFVVVETSEDFVFDYSCFLNPPPVVHSRVKAHSLMWTKLHHWALSLTGQQLLQQLKQMFSWKLAHIEALLQQ